MGQEYNILYIHKLYILYIILLSYCDLLKNNVMRNIKRVNNSILIIIGANMFNIDCWRTLLLIIGN